MPFVSVLLGQQLVQVHAKGVIFYLLQLWIQFDELVEQCWFTAPVASVLF